MKYDLIIHNGIVITVNPDFDILNDGIIYIKNGKIEQVKEKSELTHLAEADEIIDAQEGLVIPGLINTHTHLPMSLFRGMADDLPLMTWLNKHIFPAEASRINPESVKYGTLLSCAELLLSGTTTCCDGYFFEHEVAMAVHTTGLRSVLGQGVIDFPAPGISNPKKNISHAREFVEKWLNKYERIMPSIFCHSPYTCSSDTLKKAKDIADEYGILFQIHVSETKAEYDQILSEHSLSPVKYLNRLGLLDSNTLLVHSVWTEDDDIEIMAKSKVKISTATESNMKLASGIAPVTAFLEKGIIVGLGTDSCASNNNLDLFTEMDSTAKIHKAVSLDPTKMDATTIFKMATINGAEAIGLNNKIGSIEQGKQADIVIIDINKPHLIPMYNPVSHIVYNVKGSDVNDVIIDGRIIVRNKKLTTIDLQKIIHNICQL